MQEKLLKKIIMSFAGPTSENLVGLLYKKQNVNEFLIAKKMNLTINQTRNMLYKLGDEGLVGFIRKKDKKKGGWYTYFWTLNIKKSLMKYKEELTASLKELESKLNARKNVHHYYCKNCDLEFNEHDSMHYEYACPECGEILGIQEQKEITNHLREEIKKIITIIEIINEEIVVVEKKEQKTMERKIKLEKKKKDEERRARRIEREREKIRLAKKAGTYIPKKKKVKKKTKKKVKKKPKKKIVKKKVKKKSKNPAKKGKKKR